MNITVIGTGYVGLVTGVCFAEMGNRVTCVDSDASKLARLRQGISPIHEPGLEAMLSRNLASGNLVFTESPADMPPSSVCFIAVGTPQREDGAADLTQVMAAADSIALHMRAPLLVVNKSTAPVGTAEHIRKRIAEALHRRGKPVAFDVASNPEFLKEGDAVADFMRPDRIIIGLDSAPSRTSVPFDSRELLLRLYAPFSRNHDKIFFMGLRDAEMTKYAANCMLATKISFMNEIAHICEATGADVERVRRGIGADSRIGYAFIYAGCGYGGSCFPKDVQALIRCSEDLGITPHLLRAVENRNRFQKKRLYEKASTLFGQHLEGKRFAVWGLAFKPGTDDMREAPSRDLICGLITAGASVRAYDPVAMERAKSEFPEEWFRSEKLILTDHQYAALENADALFLVTEWKPFRQPDFQAMKRLMRSPVILDGRNQYDPLEMREWGFHYEGIGRGEIATQGLYADATWLSMGPANGYEGPWIPGKKSTRQAG